MVFLHVRQVARDRLGIGQHFFGFVRTLFEHPVREESGHARAGGGVRILIEPDFLARRAGVDDFLQCCVTASNGVVGGNLEVRDLDPAARLASDSQRLVDRLEDFRRFAAHMGGIKSSIFGRGFLKFNNLFGRTIGSRGINQSRGHSHRAIPHGLSNAPFALLHLLRRQRVSHVTLDLAEHGIMADQRCNVRSHSLAFQPVKIFSNVVDAAAAIAVTRVVTPSRMKFSGWAARTDPGPHGCETSMKPGATISPLASDDFAGALAGKIPDGDHLSLPDAHVANRQGLPEPTRIFHCGSGSYWAGAAESGILPAGRGVSSARKSPSIGSREKHKSEFSVSSEAPEIFIVFIK